MIPTGNIEVTGVTVKGIILTDAEVRALPPNGSVVSFTKAMMSAFRLPGEALKDFVAEMKRLTPQDKLDLRQQFSREFDFTFADDSGASEA